MLKVAITGNIASGKSVVECYLKDMGYAVFDADIIAHEILDTSDTVKNAFAEFDILTDGKIDRKKLGNIVFNNHSKLKLLENIIHPLVKNKLNEIFKQDYEVVFISVPQLFEAGFENLFDKIIFISADENVRLRRLINRNNLTEEQAMLRIKAQIPEIEKISKCDFVLKNNSSVEDIKNSLQNILSNLL